MTSVRKRPVIVVEKASVSLPNLDRKVLEEISFSVDAGKLLALIGPSDAGKSVLLKALCALVNIDEGRITIEGESVVGASDEELFVIRSRIGMLFQQGALFETLSVLENVVFPLRRRKYRDDVALRKAVLEIDRVGLDQALHLLPSELSGGMRKRVGIARALVHDPSVALYDEPIAGLDPLTGSKILHLIRQAADERGVAGIIVGHEIDTILPYCDDAAVLVEGKLAYLGSATDLRKSADRALRQFVTGALDGPP